MDRNRWPDSIGISGRFASERVAGLGRNTHIMREKTIIMATVLSLLLLFGCVNAPQPQIGGLYSVDDGEGWFRIAKVLVIDKQGVHVRLFKNRWKDRPISVDVSTLSLGTIHDKDGFGMGHLPLTKSAFQAWRPVLIKITNVADSELDGYKEWLRSGGGYFGQEI